MENMSRHEGVSCDNCLKSNFTGKRFKCLICYDFDLCENCHSLQVTASQHTPSHAMQCILTRNEFDLYYGGENLLPESPPSFVCPFCAKLGFTETLLQEHVNKEHKEQHAEVVCPVCAALPSGDPNLVTDDLAHHLSMEHRAPRNTEDSLGGRHIRRMFHPGRGLRTRNHRNMHFSGGPVGSSALPLPTLASNNNSASSSVRDSMDPIAELLSQLSGVRRSAQQLQQNVSTASQLQELQTRLQLERQRAAEIRQQLERFPNKLESGSSSSHNVIIRPSSGVATSSKTHVSKKSPLTSNKEDDTCRHLLSCLDTSKPTEGEKQISDEDERSLFVQELLLSMLAIKHDSRIHEAGLDRAVPVDCLIKSSALTEASAADSHSTAKKLASRETVEDSIDNKSTGATSCDANKAGHDNERSSNEDASAKSAVEFSASASNLEGQGSKFDDASTQTAESLYREQGTMVYRPITSGYQGTDDEDSDDDNKPPSPVPMQQRHGLRLPNRVYAPSAVRLTGGVSNTGSITGFSREDVAASTLNKHVH